MQIVECCLSAKEEYIVKRSEIVNEITTVLSDWGDLFKKFYLTNHENFHPIRRKILELIQLRSQILSGNLPVDEMKEVKLQATSEIDTGNKILGNICDIFNLFNDAIYIKINFVGLDMVVRDDEGNMLEVHKTSTTQLYEQHLAAVDRIKKATV